MKFTIDQAIEIVAVWEAKKQNLDIIHSVRITKEGIWNGDVSVDKAIKTFKKDISQNEKIQAYYEYLALKEFENIFKKEAK